MVQYIKLLKTKKIPVPEGIEIKRDPENEMDLILSCPLHEGVFSVRVSNLLEELEAKTLINSVSNMRVPVSG